MDNTKELTHISLCTGYGGIDLGLKRVLPNLLTVALCEVEAYACANLVAKMEAGLMDAAPIWSNLKTFPWSDFRDRVGILSGGYPCQPFSAAGKRLGANDERHLWPFIADGVRILRPKACFFENVEGHITLGLSTVISDLESMGYKVSWGIFSASECLDATGRTAPHKRKRVFILADRYGEGLQRYRRYVTKYDSQGWESPLGHPWPSRPGEPQRWWEPPRVVGNANRGRQSSGINAGSGGSADCRREGDIEQAKPRGAESKVGGNASWNPNRLGYGELCRASDNRTDELRLLGNGVCVPTATKAFITLMNQLKNNE